MRFLIWPWKALKKSGPPAEECLNPGEALHECAIRVGKDKNPDTIVWDHSIGGEDKESEILRLACDKSKRGNFPEGRKTEIRQGRRRNDILPEKVMGSGPGTAGGVDANGATADGRKLANRE